MSKRAGLRDSTIKLVAGVPEDLPADGNYLRISKAQYPVIVEVGNNDVYRLEPGQDVTYPIEEGFTRIRITTTAPIDDLVTITIGNNVKVGSVVIAGQVSISSMPQIEIAAGQFVTSKPMEANRNFNLWGFALAANSTTTLLDPANNPAGCYLLRASGSVVSASDLITYLKMENSAGTLTRYIAMGMHCGGSKTQMFNIEQPVYIPPGMGVYFYTSQLTLAAASGISAIFGPA